jgi:solute carrier family 25 (peroxisomal adenine nucleotide transporter), member 17
MTNTNDSSMVIPPLVHALGGSIGSTISLLLLFPLERVRIEMQAQASAIRRMRRRDRKITFRKSKQSMIEKNGRKECLNLSDDSSLSEDERSNIFLQKDKHKNDMDDVSISSIDTSSTCNEEEQDENGLSSDVNQNAQPKLLNTLYMLHVQKTLYKGSTPIALTMALSNFIFFYTLQSVKKILKQPSASILTSTIAGIVNVLLTNPFWVANLRIVKSQVSTGVIDCIKDIIRNEGVQHLWNGTGASLLLVSNPVIQHSFYEHLKMNILNRRKAELNGSAVMTASLKPLEAFVFAALAKALATIATYPIQLAQVLMRLQKVDKRQSEPFEPCDDSKCSYQSNISSTSYSNMDQKNQEREYSGTLDCMLDLFTKGGIKALYSGMDAKLIQTVLTSALTFLTYEQIVSLLARSYFVIKKTAMNKKTI